MSTHTDLVAAYYAGFNRRDSDIYSRLFTKDCELTAPGLRTAGVDALSAFDQAWASSFSEARIENLRMSESDGRVLAANWFHGGAHTRPLLTPAGPIAPSGRTFSAPYTATFEFDGGRIRSQRIVFDAEYVPVALGAARTESPLDVVKGIYDAFGRGDLAGVLSRIEPAAELRFEGPSSIPWAGTFRGPDGWTNFFSTLGRNLADLVVRMEPFAVESDRVVALGRYQGRVTQTGQRIDSPLVHLWTVRNGMIAACVELTNTAAEEAACRQAVGA